MTRELVKVKDGQAAILFTEKDGIKLVFPDPQGKEVSEAAKFAAKLVFAMRFKEVVDLIEGLSSRFEEERMRKSGGTH